MPGRKRSAGGSRASCASSNDACDRLLPIDANCGYGRASFEFEPIRGLMAKEELLEMRGQVVELLPNAMFRVKRENDYEIMGHQAGKMRKNSHSALVGDDVLVELTPSCITQEERKRD